MECVVCTEKFNKSSRKEVECLYCGYKACQKCIQRFLIENTITPKCMSCNTQWNMEFLRMNFSKSFMNKEYKAHQKESIQVEAETHLGDYQETVQAEIKIGKLKETEKVWLEEKFKIDQQLRKINTALFDIRHEIARTKNRMNIRSTPKQRQDFFMACPSHGCRGRLSTAYKCGLCSHFFCPDCHVDKGLNREAGDHECKKEDIETVEVLKENTRPCPKCHMGIFKTSGCDQMWCTQCHTCFSWRSGNILNGVIHNPHFYEWQRTQNGGRAPRVIGDIRCGGIIPSFNLYQAILRTPSYNAEEASFLRNLHRVIVHIENISLPSIRNRFQNREIRHRNLGVRYLMEKINKEEWVELLYRASKQEEKYRSYAQILETLVFNVSEFFRQFSASPSLSLRETKKYCEQVLEFANQEIDKLNKQYNSNLANITSTMDTGRL